MSHIPCPADQNPLPGHSTVEVALVALRRRTKAGGKVEILIAKRHFDAAILPGAWEIPGGKIDVGEAPSVAAARELLEETGVDCTDPSCAWIHIGVIEPPIPHIPHWRPAPRFHLYSVELPAGAAPRAVAAQAIAWIDLAVLHKIDWPQTTVAVVEALTTALKAAK